MAWGTTATLLSLCVSLPSLSLCLFLRWLRARTALAVSAAKNFTHLSAHKHTQRGRHTQSAMGKLYNNVQRRRRPKPQISFGHSKRKVQVESKTKTKQKQQNREKKKRQKGGGAGRQAGRQAAEVAKWKWKQ